MSANRIPLISPDELRKTPQRRPADWKSSENIDAVGLEAELRKNVEGEVRFDAGSKAMYAVDASNYRQVPVGVVIPRSKEDVVQTVASCRKFGSPLLSRGAVMHYRGAPWFAFVDYGAVPTRAQARFQEPPLDACRRAGTKN